MTQLFEKLLSLPKSLYASMKFFPMFQALRIPILVRYNTNLTCLSGKVIINSGGGKNSYADHWFWTGWNH